MVDHKWIGKVYEPLVYEIGREKMKEYAAAAKDMNPIYHDDALAADTKYGDIIGMPNFAAVYALKGAGYCLLDPDLKLNMLMLVHGSQEFEWFDVVKPGDRITIYGKVADIYEKGDLDFVVYEDEVRNQSDQVVVKAKSTFIIREGGR